jgi:outer membrane protein with beta-barrel domain
MKRNVLAVMTAIVAIAASAPTAHAQMGFGIAAGASIPTGDLGDAVKTGFHGMATLSVAPPAVPFGLRIDGMYNQLAGKADAISVGDEIDLRVLGLTANGVWQMPGMVASPYLIGGLGYYNTKFDISGADAENDFGLNIGIGMKFNLSGFGTFAEVRYHSIFNGGDGVDNMAFIPLTFGIMF